MELNLTRIFGRPSEVASRKSIRNIIFDFGGVICNIDVNLTREAFIGLGLKKFDTGQTITDSTGLFEGLETGVISPQQFRNSLRSFFESPVSDKQIDSAWNQLLLDIPEARIRMLEEIRKHYRIFLLSNTNEIHYNCYVEKFRYQFGYDIFTTLFDKAYFSYSLGIKKPSPEIFRFVLHDSNLEPSETLFIDDTLMHVEGARNTGINAYHLSLEQGEELLDLFH